jgi:CheY-like chemotaxis protein
MTEHPKNFITNILVAEDDPDDRLLVTRALEDNCLKLTVCLAKRR